jgi:putative hemolysin
MLVPLLAADDAVWTLNTLLGFLSIPILILINAYFVAAEFALVAIRKTRVEEMMNLGVRGAKAVKYATDHLDQSIAAAQLGITLASIAIGSVGEPLIAHKILEPIFDATGVEIGRATLHTLAMILAISLITVIHVVLGEQVPKMAAIQQPDITILWLAPPLNVFGIISMPILRVMNAAGNWILIRFGFEAGSESHQVHSIDEVRMIIDDVEEAGMLDSDQADFVQNVFKMTSKTVRDCMIPIEKMDALEARMSSEQILDKVRENGHTRLPVYEGDKNNIIGIVNTKNLLYMFSLMNIVVLEDALYPATYLDPEETISNALRLFRKSRRPMAMVRDSEGKIHGLLTLEDVLEEIVGDLEDEHDHPVPMVRKKPKPK